MEHEEEILFEVANALLLFSRSPSPNLPQAATVNKFKPHHLPPAPAMPATSIENILSVSFPSWGFHKRRSHRMGDLKRKQVDGPSPPTAEAASSNLYSSGSNGLPCSSEIRPFKRLRTGETSVQEYGAQLKLKRKQVMGPPPNKPLNLSAASNPSSSESNGEIRPLKRLRTCRTRVPGCDCDANIKFKRKEGDGPSQSTAMAANCSHQSPHTPLDLATASNPSTSALSDGFPYSSEIRGCGGFRCNDGLKSLQRKYYLSQRRMLGRAHLTL